MKKFITAMLATAMIALPTAALANGNLYLNNTPITGLYYENGTVKLGVRDFFENAGYTVQWYNDENRVTIFNSIYKITMVTDRDYVYLDGTGYKIDDTIHFLDGQLVMPLSALEKSIGAVVTENDNDIYIYSSASSETAAWKYEVLNLTNAQREAYGLQPLKWNNSLAQVAQKHCDDMLARDYFDHNTPEGLTPFDRMKSLGISYSYAAENIAAGQPDPKSVVDAWMKSEGHKKNILNSHLKELGVAYSRGGSYGIYWAQEFATTR